ncbi:MAG: HNH endonuclease signature motif containing protein [Cyanobacteria bacterium J06554_6]
MSRISETLRQQVIDRAKGRCEYCCLPDRVGFFSHEVDHVIAVKHDGSTTLENLAYACWRCNRYKGSDLGSFDPKTGKFCLLFNPRRQLWDENFTMEEGEILGKTAAGRTTAKLLKFNTAERIQERQLIDD